MPFKMHKINFSRKKIIKKYVCLPYLKFSDLLPETHIFFHLALEENPKLNGTLKFNDTFQISRKQNVTLSLQFMLRHCLLSKVECPN